MYKRQESGNWLDEAVGVYAYIYVATGLSQKAGSVREKWGLWGGGIQGEEEEKKRERGRGLNIKKPLTHAAAGPDHSTDAFVHCLSLSVSLSSPSLSFIPCVFGDTRRVQISKSHCLLRLQTGGPVRQPQSYLCPARKLEWNI